MRSFTFMLPYLFFCLAVYSLTSVFHYLYALFPLVFLLCVSLSLFSDFVCLFFAFLSPFSTTLFVCFSPLLSYSYRMFHHLNSSTFVFLNLTLLHLFSFLTPLPLVSSTLLLSFCSLKYFTPLTLYSALLLFLFALPHTSTTRFYHSPSLFFTYLPLFLSTSLLHIKFSSVIYLYLCFPQYNSST